MEGFAVVYCNLSRAEFLSMTPTEFEPIAKAGNDQIREAWERMRLQTMYLVNIQLQQIDRIWNPKVFMPFSWEDESDEDISAIDWEALDKKYARTS